MFHRNKIMDLKRIEIISDAETFESPEPFCSSTDTKNDSYVEVREIVSDAVIYKSPERVGSSTVTKNRNCLKYSLRKCGWFLICVCLCLWQIYHVSDVYFSYPTTINIGRHSTTL